MFRTILVVEDDALLNKMLTLRFEEEGYQVLSARTCRQTREYMEEWRPDLILMDIILPDGSGLALCRQVREKQPDSCVVFLTGNDQEADMLKGYEAGGADYVTKPFSMAVLTRKVRAIFESRGGALAEREVYDDGRLRIDFTSQRAEFAGTEVEFTPKEYQLLRLFVSHPRIILTKQQILENMWDDREDFVNEHALASMVSRIRKKIETEGKSYIRTTYGVGYQWTEDGRRRRSR